MFELIIAIVAVLISGVASLRFQQIIAQVYFSNHTINLQGILVSFEFWARKSDWHSSRGPQLCFFKAVAHGKQCLCLFQTALKLQSAWSLSPWISYQNCEPPRSIFRLDNDKQYSKRPTWKSLEVWLEPEMFMVSKGRRVRLGFGCPRVAEASQDPKKT